MVLFCRKSFKARLPTFNQNSFSKLRRFWKIIMKTEAALHMQDEHMMAVGDAHEKTPSTEMQQQTIKVLCGVPMQKGDERYLIDRQWFRKWEEYVGLHHDNVYSAGENSRLYPGEIDNSRLFTDHKNQDLRTDLNDKQDYVLVPTKAWYMLVSWYGCPKGQRAIVRKVIKQGMFSVQCQVEVYLLALTVCEMDKMDKVETRHFSKNDTLGTLEKELRSLFEIPTEKETLLWIKDKVFKGKEFTKDRIRVLDKPSHFTIYDAGLFEGAVVVIQQKEGPKSSTDTVHPQDHPESSTASKPPENPTSTALVCTNRLSHNCNLDWLEKESQPGLCGLRNLGNTCFMNSTLQCLINAPPLTQYFLENQHRAEINRENTLGMNGMIAEAYGELVKSMWYKRKSWVAPLDFKRQLGRFAPQFSGYQQHDSQELLAFLLDGLHEDLNRVKNKPYLEVRDAEGRPDETVAKEAWTDHRLRNDSVIVDLFHGLFKSTLVCPECSKVSVTFDPFCYLSLPLPMSMSRAMEVSLIRSDPQSRRKKYRVIVPRTGTVMDLCSALSQLSGLPPVNMVVTEVHYHRFFKIFMQDDALDTINTNDVIVVYEVQEEDDTRRTVKVEFKRNGLYGSSFGMPLLITVPITVPGQNDADVLYEKIVERIGQYVQRIPSPCIEGSVSALANHPCYRQEAVCYPTAYLDSSMFSCEPEDIDETAHDSEDGNEAELSSTAPKLFDIYRAQWAKDTCSFEAVWADNTNKLDFNLTEAMAFDEHDSMLTPKKSIVPLGTCVKLFTTMERLGEHDPWYCSVCKKHQRATKKLDLWTLPRILVIHLKRFSYNRYSRDKLETMVDFPITGLDMSEFVCDPEAAPCIYDLIAASNHAGGLAGGHYTAYGKNNLDGKWHCFDDSDVRSVSEDDIVSKEAYVLFYQRRDGKDPSEPQPSTSFGGDTQNGSS